MEKHFAPELRDKIEKIGEWIRDIRVAMLTTIGPDGTLHSRPMATLEEKFDGEVWFLTNDASPKMSEILETRQVNLAYSDNDSHRYVSLAGSGSLVRDRDELEARWSPAFRAWFPDGLDDPHLALLRVRVDSAQYWKSPSGAVTYLFGLAKAMVTGTPANPGTSEKFGLQHSA